MNEKLLFSKCINIKSNENIYLIDKCSLGTVVYVNYEYLSMCVYL